MNNIPFTLTQQSRNQEKEFEQKSLSSQRLVRRVRRASINISKFKTLAFAPQAKQYSSSRALRLLFKLSFLLRIMTKTRLI
jgi:hypothetical protein